MLRKYVSSRKEVSVLLIKVTILHTHSLYLKKLLNINDLYKLNVFKYYYKIINNSVSEYYDTFLYAQNLTKDINFVIDKKYNQL